MQLSLERPLSLEHGESGEGTVVAHDLDVDTVGNDLTILLKLEVLLLCKLGESELSRDHDSLSTGELEHSSLECHLGNLEVLRGGSKRHDDISNVHSG